MQVITTKMGSSRVYARTTSGERCSVAKDYSLTTEQRHSEAAEQLRRKLMGPGSSWRGRMVGGTQGPDTMVWVFADSEDSLPAID